MVSHGISGEGWLCQIGVYQRDSVIRFRNTIFVTPASCSDKHNTVMHRLNKMKVCFLNFKIKILRFGNQSSFPFAFPCKLTKSEFFLLPRSALWTIQKEWTATLIHDMVHEAIKTAQFFFRNFRVCRRTIHK